MSRVPPPPPFYFESGKDDPRGTKLEIPSASNTNPPIRLTLATTNVARWSNLTPMSSAEAKQRRRFHHQASQQKNYSHSRLGSHFINKAASIKKSTMMAVTVNTKTGII